MHGLFLILYELSFATILICCVIVCSHKACHMQKVSMLVCLSALTASGGWLLKIEATTLEGLITSQKVIYMSMPFCAFFMLLFIMGYCRYELNKYVKIIFHAINCVIAVFVMTNDYHRLFYKDYWTEEVNGIATLQKEYGPVHAVTTVTIVLYVSLMIFYVIRFGVQNIKKRRNSVLKIMAGVLLPFAAYLIPKFIDMPYEFHTIALAIFTAMLVLLVYKDSIYDFTNLASNFIFKSLDEAVIVFNNEYLYKGCNDKAIELFPFLEDLFIDSDIREESRVLADIVDENQTEYESDDSIFDISVRTIYDGEKIIGKVVWMTDVTMERIYTSLLKEQKKSLESEVVTLSDISYRDELTGLYNRRYYEETLTSIREEGNYEDISVMALDVNGLKRVNDEIGHVAGDELIKGAADLLKKVFPFARTFRIGGDEFSVIFTQKLVNPEKYIEEMKQEMDAFEGENVKTLSISYGLVQGYEYPDATIDGLVIIADKAMYECKKQYYIDNGIDRRSR